MSPEKASNEAKEIYQNLNQKLGKVPNIFLNLGNAPAVLKGFMAMSDSVNQTSLDPQLREQIALIVGQSNQCNYCLSAHTVMAKGAGLQEAEILKARHGQASNSKSQAILKFANTVVEARGQVTDQDVTELKNAGVSDQEIVEIVWVICQNMFTNYFNHITDPKIDFPLASELN
jgi:uncharacterized peroxidase-related enzyme